MVTEEKAGTEIGVKQEEKKNRLLEQEQDQQQHQATTQRETARAGAVDETGSQSARGRECPICYEPLGAEQVSALPCLHVFHTKCIAEWCDSSAGLQDTCPICREAVPLNVSSSFAI